MTLGSSGPTAPERGGPDRSAAMTSLVAAVLRGEPVTWPPAGEPTAFLDLTARHAVQPLLAHQLHRTPTGSGWPDEVREPLRQAARLEALAEVVRRRELQRVLAALDAAGVRTLLMKGAALAYLYYPNPSLRPRCDTDLLIRQDDRATVTQVMLELGYRGWTQTSGDLVMPQFTFVKEGRAGVWHACDFHLKILNPAVFANLLSFEEAAARSVPVPALGKPACAFGPLDALLVACIHRVAHHHDSGKLLWLYDIHLLANGMDRPAFEAFVALAAEKQVRTVCLRGLTLARRWFATPVPGDVMETLAVHDVGEPTAAFLDGRLSRVDILLSDLTALGGWTARWRLLRQHLFPPPAYMRERYAVSGSVLLPALYMHRAVQGAWKWFRRPAKVSSVSS